MTLAIEGLGSPSRTDRNCDKGGKKVGGYACLYMSERWCDSTNVCVKKPLCTEDLEL